MRDAAPAEGGRAGAGQEALRLLSGRIRDEGGDWLALEVGVEGLANPLEGRALLQRAGGHDGPKALAELLSAHAASALGDMAVNDDEAHGLFDHVMPTAGLCRVAASNHAFSA
jgi:hypothetical protein